MRKNAQTKEILVCNNSQEVKLGKKLVIKFATYFAKCHLQFLKEGVKEDDTVIEDLQVLEIPAIRRHRHRIRI